MAFKKPEVVFAHGGWHNPSCFDAVRKLLENDGFTCHIPQLPSSGDSAISMTIRDDVQLVHNIVQKSLEAGNDVLLVAHSNGGFTTCGALEGLIGGEGTTAELPGKVLGIAMIAAFITPAVEKGAFKDVPPIDTSWWVFNVGLEPL